jgi:hypothetical protein
MGQKDVGFIWALKLKRRSKKGAYFFMQGEKELFFGREDEKNLGNVIKPFMNWTVYPRCIL